MPRRLHRLLPSRRVALGCSLGSAALFVGGFLIGSMPLALVGVAANLVVVIGFAIGQASRS